jgi:adenylylsulfate kinase
MEQRMSSRTEWGTNGNRSPDATLTLWLTGLSGAGKSTLARGLAARLEALGIACELVDGDVMRRSASSNLQFSREDRRTNVLRAAEVCRSINQTGIVAIAALISPYRQDRDDARSIIGVTRFREIYVATPLDVCELRDPKGLYRKARAGQISHFTGINDPYEPPVAPDLVLPTHLLGVADCVAGIARLLPP